MAQAAPLTRRRFLAGLAVGVGATVLAACGANPAERTGGGAQTGGAQPTGTTAGAAQAGSPIVQIKGTGATSFMNWDPIEGTPYEEVIKAYEQQSGRTVEVIPTPGTGTEYETKVRTMLAGGTVPDIMRTNDDFVRYYSIKDQVRDLNQYIQKDQLNPDDYFAPIWNFAKQPDGKYTAWSLGNQPRLIFYNVNIFKEAGLPTPPKEWTDQGWKWDDFLAIAQKLTVKDQRWGALVYDDTGFEQTFSVNNGEADGLYSKDGKTFTLANPKGAEAIQWAADLTCKHGVQPERGLVREANSGNNLFVGGKVAMIFRTQGTITYFRRNAKDFEWDVAPPPGKETQRTEGSLICFTITKPGKSPDNAWDLLKFMGGPDGSKIFAERGAFIPAYKKSAELVKPGASPPASYPANIQLFAKAMEYNTTVNFTENTENARNVYRQEFDKVWNCQESAQDVLNRVRKDVEEALTGKF